MHLNLQALGQGHAFIQVALGVSFGYELLAPVFWAFTEIFHVELVLPKSPVSLIDVQKAWGRWQIGDVFVILAPLGGEEKVVWGKWNFICKGIVHTKCVILLTFI